MQFLPLCIRRYSTNECMKVYGQILVTLVVSTSFGTVLIIQTEFCEESQLVSSTT